MMKEIRLSKKKKKDHQSIVRVGKIKIGCKKIVIMAGPCAVESRKQLFSIVEEVKSAGAKIFRGGTYKPRTSPYSFQGLEKKGLKLLAEVREAFDIPVVTEVVDTRDVDIVLRYTDVIQVGARNMQNFSLLKELSVVDKPVLLKKGMMATIYDVLMAAEYLLVGGNNDVIICERGIRTFETYTRNTLDISAVIAMKQLTHLPVIVDPSHASGRSDMVPALLKAGIAAGADGAIVEVHCDPKNALCDGGQSLTTMNFQKLMAEIKPIIEAIGRTY